MSRAVVSWPSASSPLGVFARSCSWHPAAAASAFICATVTSMPPFARASASAASLALGSRAACIRSATLYFRPGVQHHAVALDLLVGLDRAVRLLRATAGGPP